MNAEQLLLTLIASPAIEEAMVDFLLALEHESGFTSFPIHGHSSRHQGLSLSEQVAGRRRQMCFELVIAATDLPRVRDGLRAEFAGAQIHYWVVPVVESGRI